MRHGGFGSGSQAEQSYGWDAQADRNGFVVAYPDGLDHAWHVDGCSDPTTRVDGVVTTSAATCPGGREVELITIDGAGHQWPGAPQRPVREELLGMDPPSTALDATDTIWQFFAAHPASA
jgi:polyhydroxybutyrate depolymerase